jgi:peptidoglycan L-alanyl-D-glutamate endopeptidase CwlK
VVLNDRSERNLKGVHPDLVRVVRKAALLLAEGPLGFIVTEGLRTKERQKELYDAGASKTMDSRHLTGHAVDLAATVTGEVRWDWPLYTTLAHLMKSAAEIEKVNIRWGGDWLTFRDGPHFELPRTKYS